MYCNNARKYASILCMEVIAYIIGIIISVALIILRESRRIDWRITRYDDILGQNNYNERIRALREARIYLAPYKDIWSNLKLVNKYCKLTLGEDGYTIEGFEKGYPYRHFKVVSTGVHSSEELWNIFCRHFSWNKSYDGLLEDCHRFGAITVHDKTSAKSDKNSEEQKSEVIANEQKTTISKIEKPKEKLDINNCSEAELTALPGISVVLAKKIIKKREEIGGFKKIDDFFLYLKLKPHMENQLKELIKVEKMKGSVTRILNTERKIDL